MILHQVPDFVEQISAEMAQQFHAALEREEFNDVLKWENFFYIKFAKHFERPDVYETYYTLIEPFMQRYGEALAANLPDRHQRGNRVLYFFSSLDSDLVHI